MDLSAEDERKFCEITFKWALAWDSKSPEIFAAISAPLIVADYSAFPAVGTIKELSPQEFFEYAFTQDRLGDMRMQTQHLLGSSVFEVVNEHESKGTWQVRAFHVRTFSNGTQAVWDSSSLLDITYVKLNEEWKFGGLRPHSITSAFGQAGDVVGNFPS
ncbi:hypothetical protein BKA66DRAFT_470091 [Pyrenochaeta sp. MPI-SDFR-AT-0127]|nr:hypothetical protein BKA66DRAFT_470091 [Pyrenochaeta sp. MPI-SDFR-AT-0127]